MQKFPIRRYAVDDVSGFGHEHNRPDRDKAIKIHWKNVNETKKQYLIKYK